MSLLGNTRDKVEKVKEMVSPFKVMGVTSIEIEQGFVIIDNILDHNKMSDLPLTKSDIKPVIGSVWDEDLCRRIAYYICRYHLEHPCDNKMYYDDIILDGKPRLPISIWLSLDETWKRTLYASLPNGSRMIIKYGC